MDRHESVQALLTGHALGELSLAEQHEVQDHLDTCDTCRRDARELSLAFQSMALADTPVAPPARVRARVLESVENRSTQAVSRPSLRLAWMGLAAMLVLALGALLIVQLQRVARLNEDVRSANAARAQLEQQIATTSAQADRAVSILTASDMRRIDLEGVDASPGAVARAYLSATQGLLIVADRLPAPPPGRAYQVWIIGGGSTGPVSAGLIEDISSGRGMLIAPPPPGVSGGPLTVAVTDEPAGGLPAPTGSKHLLGSI
jgi:anti-sigma-K factor RskA